MNVSTFNQRMSVRADLDPVIAGGSAVQFRATTLNPSIAIGSQANSVVRSRSEGLNVENRAVANANVGFISGGDDGGTAIAFEATPIQSHGGPVSSDHTPHGFSAGGRVFCTAIVDDFCAQQPAGGR